MKKKELLRRARDAAARYRVMSGRRFRLADHDPADTMGYGSGSKPAARQLLKSGISLLSEYQEMLYAQDRWSVLLVFQAMDAAGKDSAIKHVRSGVTPQGCQVFSFKAPTSEELDHDYLWRCWRALPDRGRIGIFNRSYYEETLVVRVHPELLAAQKLPAGLAGRDIWKQRFEDIAHFERYLARNGVAICKFFLNVSRDEQRKRFLDRLDEPEKHWKFSPSDVAERSHWDDYMRAYEQTIRNTAAKHAPWYVVPADNKWFTRLVVAAAVIDTLASLDLHYPRVGADRGKALAAARDALAAD